MIHISTILLSSKIKKARFLETQHHSTFIHALERFKENVFRGRHRSPQRLTTKFTYAQVRRLFVERVKNNVYLIFDYLKQFKFGYTLYLYAYSQMTCLHLQCLLLDKYVLLSEIKQTTFIRLSLGIYNQTLNVRLCSITQ